MKKCFKCGDIKPINEYYRHPKMADGHVGKCKECNKIDVRKNRESKAEYYRAYDRARGNRLPLGYNREYIARYPNKYKAHSMVGNAVRDGKLFREPCSECGLDENIHAHHDDYAKPLNVRWLCAAHHHQWHKKHGEGLNA
jgi:hypothetical protein